MNNDFYKLGEGEFEDANFDDVLNKLKILTDTSNSQELAEWLGISMSIITDARRKNTIPKFWVFNILQKSELVPNNVTGFVKDLTLYLSSTENVKLF